MEYGGNRNVCTRILVWSICNNSRGNRNLNCDCSIWGKEEMKQPKRLTRTQKELLTKMGFNWHEWLLLDETQEHYKFIKKKTNKFILIRKGE